VAQSKVHVTEATKAMAAKQAAEPKLSQKDRENSKNSYQGMHLTAEDEVAASRRAKADTLSQHEKKAAAKQSRQTKLTPQENLAAQTQATQRLRQGDLMHAMSQAAEVPMTKAEAAKAQLQAKSSSYSKVKKVAVQQQNTKLFKASPDDVLAAQKQSKASPLSAKDGQKAVRQASQRLHAGDAATAKQQAALPKALKMTLGKEIEAQKLAYQQGYSGKLKTAAQRQAQRDSFTGRVTAAEKAAAKALASDPIDPKKMEAAAVQAAGPTLSRKDLKFAIKQMQKVYKKSKNQAVDTVTKLTIKKRLEALRQADDRLKAKDAAIAKKQAQEIKLSLQDEWNAAHQAKDKQLWVLGKRDAKWASKQIESAFSGKMSAKDAKLAEKLTNKALKKRQRFLSEYSEWEEKRKEAKIRRKYEKQRQQLLGESDTMGKSVDNNMKAQSAQLQLKRQQQQQSSAPLDLDAYHQKLNAIRKAADQSIRQIKHQAADFLGTK